VNLSKLVSLFGLENLQRNFSVISNKNRETLRNLEQALQTEKLRLELTIYVFQKTRGGFAPKIFALPSHGM
jgi:hypothetical protein